MSIDNDVSKLKLFKAAYDNKRYTMQDNFTFKYPQLIEKEKQKKECILKDIELRDKNKTSEFKAVINANVFTDREEAGCMLNNLDLRNAIFEDEICIGEINGFSMIFNKSEYYSREYIELRGNLSYKVELGKSDVGNIIRIENALDNLEKTLSRSEEKIEQHKRNLEQSKVEYQKPFLYEDELKSKIARQNELNALLDMDKTSLNKKSDKEIRDMVTEHEKWVITGGKEGNQLNLENANLKGTKLLNVNLKNAIIKDCDLSECTIYADLSNADLTGSKINKTNFVGSNFKNTKIEPQKYEEIKNQLNSNSDKHKLGLNSLKTNKKEFEKII